MKPESPPRVAGATFPPQEGREGSAPPRRPRLSAAVRMYLAKAAESKRPDLLLRRFDFPEDEG